MEFIEKALAQVEFPRIVKVRQHFDPAHIPHVPTAVREGVSELRGIAGYARGRGSPSPRGAGEWTGCRRCCGRWWTW